MAFKDIATIQRGASPRPIHSYITSSSDGVNWIKIGDTFKDNKYIESAEERITSDGAKKSRWVHPGDFILSNSMSFGRPYIVKIEGCIHDGWLSISEFDKFVTPDFLYHLLSSNNIQKQFEQKASSGTVQNLNAELVRSIILPIPSIEVQRSIVDCLDTFDVVCNDLKNGIPAEIEARKKQYEYYRDKLLSFGEVDAS